MNYHDEPPSPRDGATPAPASSLSAVALENRVLLHVGMKQLWQVRNQVDVNRGGLVLCGDSGYQKALQLRRNGFAAPLLTDPAVYETQVATEETPFPQPAAKGPAVDALTFDIAEVDDPLRSSLYRQRSAGVTVAMTPTGYIHAEDSEALLAAVRGTVDLNDPDVIFAAPIDVSWLRDDNVGQLIAALKLFKGYKALMLGGQKDPLGRFSEAVENLRRVLAEVPRCALMRTDLAAFGALAHGASFTSFGLTGSVRHTTPPGEPVEDSRVPVRSPQVLFPELMGFFLGGTIARRFAAADRPRCNCSVCGDAGLDRFTSMDSELQLQTAGHNTEIMGRWLDALMSTPSGYERQKKWYEMCRAAKEHHSVLNASLDLKTGFAVGKQLSRWASLVPTPTISDATPAPQSTR